MPITPLPLSPLPMLLTLPLMDPPLPLCPSAAGSTSRSRHITATAFARASCQTHLCAQIQFPTTSLLGFVSWSHTTANVDALIG